LTAPQERKQYVGDRLFQIIQMKIGLDQAGKVTGMMLDESVVNYEAFFTSPGYFETIL
jgi:hypothetical protein